MGRSLRRREFLQVAGLSGAALYLGAAAPATASTAAGLVSPGARKSKVRVAKVYLGVPQAHWPVPTMDLGAEMQAYEAAFAERAEAFADVDFHVWELVTTVEQAAALRDRLADMDGVLAIHLSMGIMGMLAEVLKAAKPTVLFAAPYSGHEWTQFGALQREPEGVLLECMLTSDRGQLAAAVRPFRAIHHMREARILNVTSRALPEDFVRGARTRFGTEIVPVDRDRVLAAYEKVAPARADAEARRWVEGAEAVVEPSRDEIARSSRLALAFEKLLDEEQATAITVDCYGSMYRQLPAFPCIGFTRLNDMGLAGICESDLRSALTFLLLQSLSGKPGFISDPTVDEAQGGIILAHCLGSTRMDGPAGPACPYKLRSIMERQEGAVVQVHMPVGPRATQAILADMDRLLYFTGEVIDAPDVPRGCRTQITVRVDGDIEHLWKNWSCGLHRVTCYGDLRPDLRRYCRFAGIQMVDEARPVPVPPAPRAPMAG